MGVVYRFSAYHFLGQPQAIGRSFTAAFVWKKNYRQDWRCSSQVAWRSPTFRVPIGTETQHVGEAASANLKLYVQARRRRPHL